MHDPIQIRPRLAVADRLADRLVDELAAIELGVLTSYTLADAMREGSTVTGQKVGGWIEGDNACALGAAFVAATARGWIA
jgi:hypothetical protein